jgi:hypothetical protein
MALVREAPECLANVLEMAQASKHRIQDIHAKWKMTREVPFQLPRPMQ